MRYITAILLVFFCFTQAFSQELSKIRINPVQAFGGNVSEYFGEVEYIPLETNKESLFGYITRLIVTDSSMVIYDGDRHSVFFFDLAGRFIKKIKGKTEALGENIEFNEDLHCIEFSRLNRSKNTREQKYYNKVGQQISVKKKDIRPSKMSEMLSLGNGYYALGKGCYIPDISKVKDTVVNRIQIFKNEQLYRSLLPVNQRENEAICAINGFLRLPEKADKGIFYISTPLDHIVYKVDKDSAKALFQFVFPASRMISNEILTSHDKELIRSVEEGLFLRPDPLKIMNVSNIFYRGENLFFKLNPRIYSSGGGSDIQSQYNFIYNTTSGKLISLERLVADEKNYYLPLFNERVRIDGLTNFDNGYYYSNISSVNMFAADRANKSKGPQYPQILQDYFKSQNRKSNPVIVRMKLKDQ